MMSCKLGKILLIIMIMQCVALIVDCYESAPTGKRVGLLRYKCEYSIIFSSRIILLWRMIDL